MTKQEFQNLKERDKVIARKTRNYITKGQTYIVQEKGYSGLSFQPLRKDWNFLPVIDDYGNTSDYLYSTFDIAEPSLPVQSMIRRFSNRTAQLEEEREKREYKHFSEVSEEVKKDLALMYIDQGIWRQAEWGAELLRGQFEYVNIFFTKEDIQQFFEWTRSSTGQEVIKSILESNETYLECFSYDKDIEEALENIYDNEFGYLGREAEIDALAKSETSRKPEEQPMIRRFGQGPAKDIDGNELRPGDKVEVVDASPHLLSSHEALEKGRAYTIKNLRGEPEQARLEELEEALFWRPERFRKVSTLPQEPMIRRFSNMERVGMTKEEAKTLKTGDRVVFTRDEARLVDYTTQNFTKGKEYIVDIVDLTGAWGIIYVTEDDREMLNWHFVDLFDKAEPQLPLQPMIQWFSNKKPATREMSQRAIEPGGEDYEWRKAIEEDVKKIEQGTNGKLKLVEMRPFDKYRGPYAEVTINDKRAAVWDSRVPGEKFLYISDLGYIGSSDLLTDAINGNISAQIEAKENVGKLREMLGEVVEEPTSREEEYGLVQPMIRRFPIQEGETK